MAEARKTIDKAMAGFLVLVGVAAGLAGVALTAVSVQSGLGGESPAFATGSTIIGLSVLASGLILLVVGRRIWRRPAR